MANIIMKNEYDKPKFKAAEAEKLENAVNVEAEENKDNSEILEKPTTSDPTASLIYIQGHPLFHLACGIMYFFVQQSNDPLTCYKIDKTKAPWEFKTNYEKTRLNENFQTLTYIHFACFIFSLCSILLIRLT